MSSHKADIYIAHHELYHDNQPVLITSDIENIMLVSNRVDKIEIAFHLGEVCPLCLNDSVVPSFERYF